MTAVAPRPERGQRGTTLVELVITIVILGVVVAGVVGTLTFSLQHSADPMWQARTLGLAQLYLDEILAQRYDEDTPMGGVPPYTGACRIGPDGESRASFDDVDDYDGIDDQPPQLLLGSADDYAAFRVRVSVTCAAQEVGGSDLKRITVEITSPVGDVQTYSVYRGNF